MEGGLWEMVSQEKKKKKLQGLQRVMFRFLRSSYEKMDVCRDFWRSVLQFGQEFIQQSEKRLSGCITDLAEKEKNKDNILTFLRSRSYYSYTVKTVSVSVFDCFS